MYTKKLTQKAVPEPVEGFPPSPQSDLFNYLKPEQQELVKPILRILKRPYQETLCISLLDYMESGIADIPEDIQLGAFFLYLTGYNMPEVQDRKGLIRPLHIRQPKSVGTILKQMFNK